MSELLLVACMVTYFKVAASSSASSKFRQEDYGLGAQSPLSSSAGPLSERVVKSPAGEKFVLVSHRCTRHPTPLYPPSHAVVPAISRRFPRISRRFPRISRRSPRHHHDITTYTRFEEWS